MWVGALQLNMISKSSGTFSRCVLCSCTNQLLRNPVESSMLGVHTHYLSGCVIPHANTGFSIISLFPGMFPQQPVSTIIWQMKRDQLCWVIALCPWGRKKDLVNSLKKKKKGGGGTVQVVWSRLPTSSKIKSCRKQVTSIRDWSLKYLDFSLLILN